MVYLISGHVLVALNRTIFMSDIVPAIPSPGHFLFVEVLLCLLRLSDTNHRTQVILAYLNSINESVLNIR